MAVAKRVFFVFMILAILTSVYSITRGNVQHASAATPATLNFQARLMTSSGNLVPDGNYNIEFKLYNASTSTGSSQGACTGDSNCLWTETRTGGNQVQVKNGYLSAYLGDVTALPSNIWDQQLWLTMNIGGTGLAVWDGEMTPRIRMTSVPYAFQAKSSETLNKNTGSFTGTVDFATMTADRRFLFPDTSLATTASPGTICVYNGAASNCPAASGSAYYLQNDTVLQTQTNFHLQARDSGANGTIGGVITGAANGQTVDLLQFRASDDTTVLAAVTAAGNLQVASSVDTRTATTLNVGTATATAISVGKAGVTTTIEGALVVDESATFNDDVTIAAQQTIRFVGGTTAQRPASPQEGMMYFDTDTKQLLVYANGKWQGDRSAATKIVAASNSSQSVKDSADYVADGTSDEDTINAALSAAVGGTVYLASGTYTIDGTVLIPNNTKLVGNGEQSIIQLSIGSGNGTAVSNLDTAPGSGGITIRDLRIDGSLGTGGTQHGIRFDGLDSVNSEITSARLTGWANGSAIMLEDAAGLSTLSKSFIEGDVTLTGSSGIALMSSNIVSGNVSLNASSMNNMTNNNIGGGVTLAASSSLISMAANLIAGALVINSSSSESIVGNYLGEVSVNGSDDVTIEANTISLSGTDAIDLVNSDGTRIVNNRIVINGGSGYSINISDPASNNTYIAGNDLAGLGINNLGTGTVIAGQVGPSGDYVIQPTADIELMKNTNITGGLTVSGTSTFTGQATFDGGLRISDGSSNYATITVGPLAGDYSVTIPTITANDTFCLVSLANCAYDGGDFIQNQNASAQTTANFWISGTARSDTSVLTPLLDTGTAVALNIGTTNATQINLNKNVVVAAGQSLTITGGNTGSRPASPTEGMLYYDTTTRQLLIYANGKWQADSKTATFIVAASNSSQSDKDGAQYLANGEDSSGSGIGTLDGDQVQINQALDAAEAAGGGTVYLLPGTYTVDAAISVPNNVTLAGSGTGTLIRLGNFGATSVNISAITSKDTTTGTGVIVRDLRVDGRSSINTNGTHAGIGFVGVGDRTSGRAGGRIENVAVDNFRTYSIYLNNSAGNVVTNVSTNNSTVGIQTGGTAYTNTISDSTFGGGNYGIVLGAGGNLVSNNVLYGNALSGIYVTTSLNNVSANLIGSPGGSTTMNAIYLVGGGATDNTVTNNALSDTSCSSNCYAINIDAAAVRNYLADNTLGTLSVPGSINNLAGTSTILAGQLTSSPSGNYQIQPAGTIELMKNTNVAGHLSPTANNTYDLGTSSLAWRTGYFGTSVLTPSVDTATATALGIGTTNATNITVGHNAGTFAVDGTNFDLATNGVMTLAGGQTADITTQANQNLTVAANGTGTITLNDTVTVSDTLTLRGATDITTSNNENLTVTANGTGIIELNDTVSVAGNFTVTSAGNVAFQRNTTDYTATGTQDNVNFGTGVMFRITSASAVTINGISGGADGRIITLVNASANDVTLGNSASGTAANNIVTGTGGALIIPTGGTAQLAYDSSAPGTWRVIGGTATAGGGANRQLSNLSGTVAINLGLVPAAASDNALDLGSATTGWRSLYADTSVLTPLVGRATAGTLEIGTDANSTAVTISRTGVLTTVTGSLQVNQGTELRGGLTVTNGGSVAIQAGANYSSTGTVDNVNFGTGALFRITSASALTINGISGGTDGRLITLMNASANTVTLGNNASGTAANNIVTGTGGNLVVPAGSSVQLAYDSSSTVWRVIGGTAVTGGAANQQLSNLSGTIAVNASLTPDGDATRDLGSASFSWRTVYADTSVLTALVDTPSATALNIGTTNATQINLNKNTVVTGNVTLAQGANRELRVEARSTAGTGYDLTVAAGAANGSGNVGGGLFLQGGAAVAGNANGGAVTIAGGAGVGTGSQGLVNLSTTAFSTSPVQNFGSNGNLTSAITNIYSTVPVSTSATGITVTVDAPSQATTGRILYLSNVGVNDFNILLAGTSITIALKPNTTATLIWNGNGWTAAGASSSTDLQSAYNNTLTSAGGAEIVLNPTGGAADGFTIRNNGTTPISGGILEVQSSIGTNLFSVNNFGTELAANGGAETNSTFATNWSGAPLGGSASRTTTAGQYVTGQAGVSASTTSTSLTGVRNHLSGNPVNTIGAKYQVSFTAKSTVNGTQIQVDYSRNGGTNMTTCSAYGTDVNADGVDDGYATLSNTDWTKVTCTITIDSATAVTDPDLFIRKIGASTPTIYIDNLSFMRNDTTTQPSNVQVGGGINGGPVTLFTLDRSSAPPVADGDEVYLGSMYYDTTTGRIQCYEADGWGACGSPPDNIITLTPEYTGAVLNGNGIGVMTADFCGAGVLNVNATFCGTGEARNYYRWTSPQGTNQSYSVYVNYKLPSTFKSFADANTMKITTRSDDLSLARADLEVFRKAASGGISSCGAHTTLNDGLDQWQQKTYSGNETTCGFQGGDYIIFKITVHSSQAKNIYVENIDFTYLND